MGQDIIAVSMLTRRSIPFRTLIFTAAPVFCALAACDPPAHPGRSDVNEVAPNEDVAQDTGTTPDTMTPDVFDAATVDVAEDSSSASDADVDGINADAEDGLSTVGDVIVLADASDDARVPMPDFSLPDDNMNSASYGTNVSPRDHLGQVTAWYFGHST